MKINKIVLFDPHVIDLEDSTAGLEDIEAAKTSLALIIQIKKLINEHSYKELNNGMLMLPTIFIVTNEHNNEFVIKYDVITHDEGILTLFKTATNGKEQEVELGDITSQQLESYINEVIYQSFTQLSSKYFPKPDFLSRLSSLSLWSTFIYSLLGICLYCLTNYQLYSNHFETFDWLYSATFIFNCLILFAFISRKSAQQKRSVQGKKLSPLIFPVLIISVIFTLGSVQTTAAIIHTTMNQRQTIDLTLTDVKTYGSSARTPCASKLTVDIFMQGICIESRAYSMIATSGMKIQASGDVSIVGMEIKSIKF